MTRSPIDRSRAAPRPAAAPHGADAGRFRPRPFQPAPWAPGPHAQTLLARALRTGEGLRYERERLSTPDGDFIDVDWGPDPGPHAPLVLVLHGLEGSTERGYVRNVCLELVRVGHRPVAMNFRGCSGEPNVQPHSYHSGATDDPLWLLELLRARHPDRPLGAVGFSLGGNVLLKLLGERSDGGRGLLDAAVAVSVPYDLAAGCALLERTTMGRTYAGYFLRSLQSKVRAKETVLSDVVRLRDVYAARSLRAFDECVTAPLNGFRDASHYYELSSSARYLASVRVPTLLLHASDDPFLPPASIPEKVARSNPVLHLVLQPRGGHVGFLFGTPWRPRFWADEEAARFLSMHLAAAPPSATAPRTHRG
jgi:predicted alpha/beta-fold hydrolase